MDDNAKIGHRIFNARKNLDMSRAELGKRVNLHESTIKRYEDGEIKSLDINKLRELADALNVPPANLIGWNDNDDDLGSKGSSHEQNNLPPLTPKDEKEIARDLEAMINALDNKSGMAAYNDPEDEEDMEALRASLLASMRLAKQIAKKKFTPNKYRQE